MGCSGALSCSKILVIKDKADVLVCLLDQEDLLRREWLTTPVFLPGESHGQRSLVGCSP